MKKIITFTIFCFITVTTFAQTVSEYGNWFYYVGWEDKQPKPPSHFGVNKGFPPKSITDLENTVTVTPRDKTKMSGLVEALKAPYPKPKYHSLFYELTPSIPNRDDKAILDYRFGYKLNLKSIYMWVKDGTITDKKIDWSGNMQAGILTAADYGIIMANINCIPDFLLGSRNEVEGVFFEKERHLTYHSRKVGTGEYKDNDIFKDKTKDIVVSITNNYESFTRAEKVLGNNANIPSTMIGNGADEFFTFRNFSSNQIRKGNKEKETDDRFKIHTANNMVILSYNNKLPLIPLTIERFLNIAETNLAEDIEFDVSNNEATKTMYNKKHGALKKFINQLREVYKDKLQNQAILALPYQNLWGYRKDVLHREYSIWNNEIQNSEPITNDLLKKIFTQDTKNGRAYYTYDKTFYKGMVDGEIRTICLVWKDIIRSVDHSSNGKGYVLNNNRISEVSENGYTDNPDFYLSHFYKKMDWNRLKALLGK
jgi:hypothetical protein